MALFTFFIGILALLYGFIGALLTLFAQITKQGRFTVLSTLTLSCSGLTLGIICCTYGWLIP